MNKIFKVIWNEARNAYVVVSEIAKNHGSKSCSTKKLLAMLIATGVMTCASFDVLAAEPAATATVASQYVALKAAAFAEGKPTRYNKSSWDKDFESLAEATKEWNAQRTYGKKLLGDYTYKYDNVNGYWVREGYVLTVDENGGKYTQLSDNAIRADVAYTGTGVPEGILQSVTSTVARNGVVTHSGDSLQKVTAGSYAGVSNFGGTEVAGSWNYIINDSSWENSGAEYKDGYVDLVDLKGDKMPRGFKTTDSGLNWDEVKQTYTYQGKAVDYRNMYVIDGRLGVFTNYDGSEVYTGTVYGKHNEILMTVKDNGKFYSYWADSVTDPSATMETYPVSKYNSDLAVIDKNITDLNKDIIKEVTLTKDTNSAIIGLVRNGGKAVDGAITVTSGGGTEGKDTFVKISNAADTEGKNFATGSKVSVTQNAAEKTTTITVDDKATIITDTDTTYTEGDGIAIDKNNKNAISVKLNKDEKNLVVDGSGLALNTALTGIQSITGEGAGSISFANDGIKFNNKVTINKDGKITGVADGKISADSKEAVNGSQLNAVKETANKGWNLSTNGDEASTKVAPGETVDFSGDKNISVSHDGTNVKVELNDELKDIKSISNGNKTISLDGTALLLKNGDATLAIAKGAAGMQNGAGASVVLNGTQTVINGGVTFDHTGKITNVKAGEADTDAVNVGQLKDYVAANDTHIKSGDYVVGEVTDSTGNKSQGVSMYIVNKEGNVTGTVTITDVAKASDVGNVNDIADDLKNGGEGKTTVVEAVNNLNNKLDTKVGDLQYSKVGKGDIADGDSTTTAIGKLDQKLTDVAATAAKHTKVEGSSNIIVTNTAQEGEAANYEVKLNKDIDVDTVKANSVTTGQTVMDKDGLKVGDKVSVSATAVTAGKTSISDEGVKVGDKTYISADGLNANGQHITNVKAGEADTDAVNYGQLKDTNNRINGVENQVISNSNRINQLGNRVNKVGAGAAALAALHPMDFDPDDKLTFSAGYGNYGGENAAAIGAYYRPDEKVMFSVAGTVGNGENMVNAGVSFALDRTNHVSNSRTALAREVIDLRGQLAVMGAKMAKMEKAFGMLDETKTKLFPDVPANHWAYEYIAKLAGNGYIEGYPDGNFGGDRLMTRYEFAAMLYRAIEKGAALEEKIIKEFEPELGRIRVDRISGEDGDRDKIERVRVNDTKGERDHYGNKLAK